jgi:HK97 family phage portal protein
VGFWDFLRNGRTGVDHFTPNVQHFGADELYNLASAGTWGNNVSAVNAHALTPAQMWATQPHLRTVVSFVARNIAQLGLHSFERLDETDRRRDRTSPVAQVLRRPNPDMTCFELVFALIGDLALYDVAYWVVVRDSNAPSGWTITRIPVPWVTPIQGSVFSNKSYVIRAPKGESVEVDASQILAFSGYHPSSPRHGSPTIEALKETLQEQIEASKFRNQVWKRGGRVSAVLQRPQDAPEWSPEAREQFREDWYAKYTGNGPRAGGTPILEDGMTLNRVDFSAAEQQFVEGAKLSFATVASAFHVNPTMVGILDNANYSNVREFRRMLYGDTLGPLIAQIEDRLNTFLLPMVGMNPATSYLEFNIAEKLQGSFEEQAAVMSTLVGRPIMSADEGRARFNLPAMGGEAESLVVPLNVLIGGQASPTDSAPPPTPPKAAERRLKAAPDAPQVAKAAEVLGTFFSRQAASVLGKIAAGGDWWDGDRWDRELSADLLPVTHSIAETVGKAEAARLGFDEGYHGDRTVNFLKAVAARYASGINATTKGQIDAAIADDTDPAEVFKVAKDSRAAGIGQAVTTYSAGFGTVEAAKQIAYDNDVKPTKTWVTGPNPRPEHAAMDGETVGIDEDFSDGNGWPGGDPGCNCSVDVEIP